MQPRSTSHRRGSGATDALEIGPVADFKRAVVVDRLPKTRSGKILRATMVKIADGSAWKMPATIDDAASLDEIRTALQTIGSAKP